MLPGASPVATSFRNFSLVATEELMHSRRKNFTWNMDIFNWLGGYVVYIYHTGNLERKSTAQHSTARHGTAHSTDKRY
jgi:hypothetical protein